MSSTAIDYADVQGTLLRGYRVDMARHFVLSITSAATAQTVGDVGDSAPANWIGGLANGAAVHLILSLWVDDDSAVLEKVTVTLRAAFAGCMMELSAHDGKALPDNHVHFGYRDNI